MVDGGFLAFTDRKALLMQILILHTEMGVAEVRFSGEVIIASLVTLFNGSELPDKRFLAQAGIRPVGMGKPVSVIR
jgi:hypothetical protein